MDSDERIDRLHREVRRLRLGLGALALCGVAAALLGAVSPPGNPRFATVTAERVNIVEPDGTYRVVLTNAARSPGPMLKARDGAKEGKRNFPIGGIVIYDRDGQEQGGYGTGASTGAGSLGVATLDWPGGPTSGFGEAVTSFRRVDAKGATTAGVHLSDRPMAGEDPRNGVDHRRIKLQNLDRDAEVSIADANGRDRIRLRVDRTGEASIEILDAVGKPVFRAPAR